MVLLSLKTGGTGPTLTAARDTTDAVHIERWWNPAVEDRVRCSRWR